MMAAPNLDPIIDGGGAHFNISTFDLLLIELVPLAERMARAFEASLDRPSNTGSGNAVNKGLGPKQQQTQASSSTATTTQANDTAPGAAVPIPAPQSQSQSPYPLASDGQPETDIYRDSVYVRLERLGFRVGQGLCERFSRDRPRFTDHLDVIKFICKDLWGVLYKKQIDNLKTNHRVRCTRFTSLLLQCDQ